MMRKLTLMNAANLPLALFLMRLMSILVANLDIQEFDRKKQDQVVIVCQAGTKRKIKKMIILLLNDRLLNTYKMRGRRCH